MKMLATTKGGARGFLVLGLLFSAALPMTAAWGQTQMSSAFGIAVSTPTVNSTSPLAVLPTDGSLGSANTASVSVAGVAGAANLFAMATGSDGSAEGDATLENVSLLNGLITADGVMALASSAFTGAGASSNAEGSLLDNLVVNGVAISGDVAPNTNIALTGVGYVVLNEQIPSGDGVTSSGLTVNMIHVYLQGLVTGEIIVGSAASAVGQ